ncbi:L-allo-threonine aldolase [Geobacter sp. OR-1]|nr:GntG family PLP-dependent aldolase [Geobacter sp. OR-1]GAM07879.1 L-allo-threonine aldolase [Geobacter sp. OR-1]
MAHCYRWEAGGAAVFGSIQPQPVEFEPDGTLAVAKVEAVIKPVDDHYARTRLICLENTQAGKPLPMAYLPEIRSLALRHGLALHMDGARLFNASVAQGIPVSAIAGQVDSLNVCLSKGLGAPVGSILCGSRDFIREARHWRKMAGGGMRQAGMLAAAGIHALQHHIDRLAEDHYNATLLAEGLADIDGLKVDTAPVRTNMVFVKLTAADPAALESHLKQSGVLVRGGRVMRLVTHLDIDQAGIVRAVEAFRGFFDSTAA